MEDFGQILAHARKTFATGRSKNVEWRRQQLKQMLKMFKENSPAFCEALRADLGKPAQESISFEIEYNANLTRHALSHLDDWVKDEPVEKNVLTLMDTTFIHRDPLGVVLVIGAWNYPLQLSLAPAIGAIAAGNAVVIKPSELSPATAEVIKNLVHKYLDRDMIRVVLGGVQETTELLKHRFDHILFTGSSVVGKVVAAAASKHLTPCTLELGGKCPLYLDESVNMDFAARRILWGKMANLGQTCVAPDYILCSADVRDKFVDKARQVYAEFYDLKKSEDICRIVSERHFDRLAALVKSTRGKVAALGGGAMDRADRFMDLAVITDVDEHDPVMQEELFGPILPVLTVGSADEAVRFVNAREKPLSLYVFSDKKAVQAALIEGTSSGSVCCNDVLVHLSVETLPFGGVGESGYGAYHGHFTYKTFSHQKAVLKRDLGALGEWLGAFRYPPYSEKKTRTGGMLVKSRRLPSLRAASYLLCVVIGAGLAVAGSRMAHWL